MRVYLLAAGFGFTLIPPILLPAAAATNLPWLPVVVLLLMGTVTRAIFGDMPEEWPEWSEPVARALHALPAVVAIEHVLATGAAAAMIPWASLSFGHAVAWIASFWFVWLFASCPAHELLHRKAPTAYIGRLLSGVIGHPLQEHEHRAHHGRATNVALDESPAKDASMIAFTLRRLFLRVLPNAIESNKTAAAWNGGSMPSDLFWSVLAAVATAGIFAFYGGLIGLAVYAIAGLLTAWAIQAVQYLQHWGLGADEAAGDRVAWEDRCLFQTWMTFGISMHQAHHHNVRTPYYRLKPDPEAPRAPASYIVLLIASTVPPVWRALMDPALAAWRANPRGQQTAGRRLFCITRPTTR